MSLSVEFGAALDRLEEELRDGAEFSLVPNYANDNSASEGRHPEIDCVRHLISRAEAASAERRADDLDISAEQVLICAGSLSEETYLRALARWLDTPFENCTRIRRDDSLLDDEKFIESAAHGFLPLGTGTSLRLVTTPRDARQFLRYVATRPELRRILRLTTQERLQRFVFRHGSRTIGQRAAQALRRTWPMLSASPSARRVAIWPILVSGLAVCAFAFIAPLQAALTFNVTLALIFLAWTGLRLAGILLTLPAERWLHLRDDQLPIYTVIVALYREAASVRRLVNALRRLNYPREKLDVKIVVEPDDHETLAALSEFRRGPSFEVIAAPRYGPRTKPKALNVALPFARGSFTVVYDAEDLPEPDQLRTALAAFEADRRGDLACVQARLTIDNTGDSWLARLFTAEYAGQFDVFLPGLAVLRLPLPLGGSSNHFRTEILQKMQGWDSYNVTEDADLGMRLARFGYRASVINSSTYEEAPSRLRPWLKQRTRWFKGWMQTWAVHMRRPSLLLRQLGVPAFLTFQLVVGGNVLSALIHPLFVAGFIYAGVTGMPIWTVDTWPAFLLVSLFGITVLTGYLTSIALGCIGLARRGLLINAWVLLLTPLHWMLLSLAAWRALYQLALDPYRWEKTEHGLARTSRLAKSARPRRYGSAGNGSSTG